MIKTDSSSKEFFFAILVLITVLITFKLTNQLKVKSINSANTKRNVEKELNETPSISEQPITESVSTETKPGVAPKPKSYPKPVITYFTATPTTVFKREEVTFSWSTENATTIMLDGFYVAAQGTKIITENISFPHNHTLSVSGLGGATHKNVYIIASNPPATVEILGTCSYSAGPSSSGTTCKTHSDCLDLPGGIWIGEICG